MKTTKRHQFEIVFYSLLFSVIALSLGYFIAMAQASAHVRANAAGLPAEHLTITLKHDGDLATVTIATPPMRPRSYTAQVNVANGTVTVVQATDAHGNRVGGDLLRLIELVVEEYETGLDSDDYTDAGGEDEQ